MGCSHKGSSALRSALYSLYHDEVMHYSSYEEAGLLFDMEKFYDNVDIAMLVDKAIELEYPIRIFALGIQMHMAPRGVKCYNTHPGSDIPRNGIIAGCTQSTYFTKGTPR